jgi:tripartite-type tricarboxylate transporter receptor subunit TctC
MCPLDEAARALFHGFENSSSVLNNETGGFVMRRRTFLASLAASALPFPAFAQDTWPDGKVIKVVVPFPPGGTVDIVTRFLVQPLNDALKANVIVENKPGAGTNIATEFVARAAPDGLTLLMGGIPNAINETLYEKLSFDVRKDLLGVSLIASLPNVLVINPNVPAKNLAEFVAYNRANPGKVTFASGGIGTSPHLCAVMFGNTIGAPNLHVPYRGSAPASQDLVAGQVQAQFDSVGSAIGQIQAGRLRALAVTSAKRAPQLPDVPTMAEGGVENFVVDSWSALMAPKATPPAIVNRLASTIETILKDPKVQKQFADRGYVAMGGGPKAYDTYLNAEIERWAKVIKSANIKVH